MKTKRSLYLITCLVVLGVQVSEAQFLRRLKEAAKKEVNKVADELTKKEKGKSTEDNTDQEETRNEDSGGKNDRIVSTAISEGITYDPPNENFQPFTIQAHKGLPRFGVLNSFGAKKPIKAPIGYETYTGMLYLKYDDILDHSLILHTSSSVTFLKYFCNDEKGGCNEKNRNSILNFPSLRSREGVNRNWGGYGANQFDRERKQKDYMDKHKPALVTWSKSFWPNNSEIAYIVDRVNLGEYDFDKGGYWLRSIAHRVSKITGLKLANLVRYEYIPENRIEKEIELGWVLLKINETEAENLANNKTRTLYSTVKIKLAFHKKEPLTGLAGKVNDGNIVLFKYNYESPIVEFYEDEGLTKKIGEISYEDVEHSSSMFAPNDTTFKN